MPQQVKVKNDKFEPAAQNANTGDTLSFQNKRDQGVTITLDSNFFNPSTLTLAKDGNNGSSGSVTITGTVGNGTFKAPKQQGPEQDENDIKGEITINPKK